MDYIISFLEGIVTFISPCLLPMLPIYISFFAGQKSENKKRTALMNSIGFVCGFTIVFTTLGAFAGTVGGFLNEYRSMVNFVSAIIIILFGLNFMEIIRIPFINKNHHLQLNAVNTGFFSSVLFGIIFSIGWTPCIGTFLGSALMLAASSSESLKGILMLLCFSAGLGIPFIASALLLEQLKSTFLFIKKHYRLINSISGGLLVVIGLLMATGYYGYLLSALTF